MKLKDAYSLERVVFTIDEAGLEDVAEVTILHPVTDIVSNHRQQTHPLWEQRSSRKVGNWWGLTSSAPALVERGQVALRLFFQSTLLEKRGIHCLPSRENVAKGKK